MSTSIPILSPLSEHFYQTTEEKVYHKDPSVLDSILVACGQAKNPNDVQKMYALLVQALPDFSLQRLRILEENYLPLLLENSTPTQQQDLALQLARWYMEHATDTWEGFLQASLQAMHYAAKAIQIGIIEKSPLLQEVYSFTGQIFIRVIEQYLIKEDGFKKRISLYSPKAITKEDIHGFETFTKHITQIELLEPFCFSEKDHLMRRALYEQVTSILTLVTIELKPKYHLCNEQTLVGLGKPFSLPMQQRAEKYSEELALFRSAFITLDTSELQTPNTIRAFQKSIINVFKNFFQILLDDAFAILGPPPSTYKALKYSPPCTYDIRAMGSIGREEVCPYSDLEFMILIQDEKAFAYFKTLVHILEIQIASLGETSTNNPVFTCIHIKNPSGFHIDSSPTLNASLIQTPVAMAEMQNNSIEDPCTIENTVLKTISLSLTDPSLFTDYQAALEEPLKTFREERAFSFFTIRLSDYKKHWKQPFNPAEDIINIKQHYVEILNHLLSDMALFYGITKTNTLDIIDALTEIKIFTEESGLLLKESVAVIYAIRIRLHTLYKEQKEEGSCNLHPHCKQLLPFEILALEKCYWLILRPLYEQLQAITTPTEFKTIFKEIDLIQIAFKQNLSSQTVTKPFITHLTSHLCQINASIETHLDYFKALSELPVEYSRQIYLEVLEKKQAILPLQRLLYVPNRSGLRPIFLKEYEWVKQGLSSITDPFDTQVPGQTVVCITAPHFTKPRYLKPSLISKIMNGENIKSEYNSAHSVCTLSDQGYHFHLKQKPSHPLMEYAIHNLSSRIAGKLTPSVELVRFEIHSNGRKKSYPVLISETIPGTNLKNTKGPYNAAQYTWMLLLAILTRPGDGRLSNYIVGGNGMLYCIDNDISFAEPVIREWGSRTVYFCSALFCLTKLDTPLDIETLKEFVSLDGDAIFHAWIEDVIAKEETYTKLFSKEEIVDLFKEDEKKNSFTPTILFKEGALATLSLQFWQLQNKIAYFLTETKILTAGDLLKGLISLEEETVGTHVYKAYNNTASTPEERLQQATSRKQEQSITSIQSHQVCLGKVPTIQEIMTKQLYSPQKAKEEFFSTLLQRNSHYASVRKLQDSSIIEADFKELKQETRRQILVIKALTQQFKMMEQKPRTLIFHHCSVLTSDLLEPFLHPRLEKLDLRYCEKIDNKTIRTIHEQCPNLKELSLAGCIGITDISTLTYQMLAFQNLEDLDVSYCINLHTLKLNAYSLWNLKGRSNPLLKEVQLISCIAKADFIASPQVNLIHTKLEQEVFFQRSSQYITIKNSPFVVIEANFEKLQKEERRQTFLLNALIEQKIMKEKPRTLIFRHNSVLTSDLLESFLHSSLRQLEFHHCEKIDNRVVTIIQKQCPNLKTLSLNGCIGVTEIIESSSHPILTNLEDLDVSHCSNLHTLKLQVPSLQNLKGSHNPVLQEVKLGSDVIKTASRQVDVTRPPSFGKKEWAKYFGDIGIEPPLPQNIHEILNSPCLFWPDKKVSDTHLLVLVPETVNGKPLTLNSLQELVQKPKEGHKTKYRYCNDDVKNELRNQSTSSHWVLMTRDVIPESRSRGYEDQKKLLASHAKKSGQPYELPTTLDAVTCILMAHVQSGTKLYSDNPTTYTRCQEKVKNQWPVAIGGFAAGGLGVSYRWRDHASYGVGGWWKFWPMVFGTWAGQWRMVFGGKTGRS